jgi:plasmid maintenance system antidote protein VapI
MDALDLVVRRPLRPVTNADVAAIPTWAKALEAAAKLSGLIDKSLAIECGVDPALFSRMVSGQAGWTGDKLERFMESCGTELPLMWLNHRRGYDVEAMRQRETELQAENRRLREQLEEAKKEHAVILRFVREAKAA